MTIAGTHQTDFVDGVRGGGGCKVKKLLKCEQRREYERTDAFSIKEN